MTNHDKKLTPKKRQPVSSASAELRLRKVESLVGDYESISAAAEAWGISQSTLSRIMNGSRNLTNKSVHKIIAAEDLPEDWFDDLRLEEKQPRSSVTTFRFNVDEPGDMLRQLEGWFRDLPSEGPTKPRVVRAVMRMLMDESFSEIHPPTEAWRFVMSRLDGFVGRRPGRWPTNVAKS